MMETLIKDDDDMLRQHLAILKPHTLRPARSPGSDSTGSSSSAITNITRPNTSIIKLQFINTVHPSESTSAKRISQIRSHVAKDSHARRRQRNAGKTGKTGQACVCSCSTAVAADPPVRTETPDSTSTSAVALRARLPLSSASGTCLASAEREGLSCRGFRRIAPKTAAVGWSASSPGPRQMIGDVKRDAWNGSFAWDLSDDEYDIFNFYLDWVLQYGYEVCFPRCEAPAIMRRLKSFFVPFAISHPCLLACMFYISYHRRSLTTEDAEEAAKCKLMTERYRLACIKMMKGAIAAEERPTYQTVTLALQLCSEAYFEGNIDTSLTHAYAARTMVAARGGLETFGSSGVNGLISFLLVTSVYSGNYWFVHGCAMPSEG